MKRIGGDDGDNNDNSLCNAMSKSFPLKITWWTESVPLSSRTHSFRFYCFVSLRFSLVVFTDEISFLFSSSSSFEFSSFTKQGFNTARIVSLWEFLFPFRFSCHSFIHFYRSGRNNRIRRKKKFMKICIKIIHNNTKQMFKPKLDSNEKLTCSKSVPFLTSSVTNSVLLSVSLFSLHLFYSISSFFSPFFLHSLLLHFLSFASSNIF